jgi:tetratricopeptide (TPR) repeat protein
LLSAALSILQVFYGWSAKDLAEAVHLDPGTLSAYKSGGLPRDRLDSLAAKMGAGPEVVELALFVGELFLSRFLNVPAQLGSTTEEQKVTDRALALGLREKLETLVADLSLLVRNERIRQAHQQAEEDWERLKAQPPGLRRLLVEAAPEYQAWAFVVRLCEESAKKAAHDPAEALELARLAIHAARQPREPDDVAWRGRLEGYATAFEANAFRVAGHLKAAAEAFARAWTLWGDGPDPAGLLAESRLFDLEASLLRDQGRFAAALERLAQARERAAPGEAGRLLLKESAVREQMGDFEGSIAALDQAAGCIDAERQPRLVFGLRYNQATNLCRLGKPAAAAALIAGIRQLAERLRNDIDLLKVQWLEAVVVAGLGRLEEAIASLEQVCRDFRRCPLPCDFALAGLDLALLYRQAGRWPGVQQLAAEMVEIFQREGIHRKAVAALILFQNAAANEAVTHDLVYRLQDYLKQCRRSPATAGRFAP